MEVRQDKLLPPSWLNVAAKRHFRALVSLQLAAGVDVRTSDTEQYAQLADLDLLYRQLSNGKDPEQLGALLTTQTRTNQLRKDLGFGPANRARLGVRKKAEDQDSGPKVLKILKTFETRKPC